MRFKQFLEDFLKRIDDSFLDDVHYQNASPDDVSATICVGTSSADGDKSVVVLDPKYEFSSSSKTYSSVTDLALSEEESLVNSWEDRLEPDIDFNALLAGEGEESAPNFPSLVVEDIAPDSCFGFLVWIARMAGVSRDEILEDYYEWVEAAKAWEAGFVNRGSPFESWPTLLNALGHSYIDFDKVEENDSRVSQSLRENMTEGWKDCLSFTARAMARGLDPYDVTDLDGCAEYDRAFSYLNYEYQQYDRSLEHARLLQLLVPLKGSVNEHRKKLVDVYVATETTALGSKKVFLRSDKENPWLKSGFTLMAVHRPDLEGTGNDIVVSLDPSSGLHLKDLWMEVERYEQKAWQESDSVRPGYWFDSETKGSLLPRFDFFELSDETKERLRKSEEVNDQIDNIDGVENLEGLDHSAGSSKLFLDESDFPYDEFLPLEPWYLGVPDNQGTLLAAPGKIQISRTGSSPGENGEEILGRKLSWQDVLEIIWKEYSPAQDIKVTNITPGEKNSEESTEEVELMDVVPTNIHIEGITETPNKNKIFVNWEPGQERDPGVMLSPTFKKSCAEIVKKDTTHKGLVESRLSLQELPDEAEYDFLKVDGGFAVIHTDGVFFMDDWQTGDLPAEKFNNEIQNTVTRLAEINRKEELLDKLNDEITHGLENGKVKDEVELLDRLNLLQIQAKEVITKTRTSSKHEDVREFRDTLEKRWGVKNRLEEIFSSASELEEVVRHFSEVRTNRFINWITLYGFPLVFFANFFGFAFHDLPEKVSVFGRTVDFKIWGIHLLGLSLYATLAILAMFWLLTVSRSKINEFTSEST